MAGERAVTGTVRRAALRLLAAAALLAACHPGHHVDARDAAHRRPAGSAVAQPDEPRDLFWGVGGERLAPEPARRNTPSSRSSAPASARATPSRTRAIASGASSFRPRRPTEVVASRHPLGHRLPPAAGLSPHRLDRRQGGHAQPAAAGALPREQAGLPRARRQGTWSYYHNPFVGTPQLQGLLVLQAMLGNSDLKDDNNAIYELTRAVEGAKHLVRRARSRAHLRAHRRPPGAARRYRRLRADAVHHRRRQRPGHARLARPARRAVRRHQAVRRPLDLRPARDADRPPMAGRLPGRRLRRRDRGPLHPPA